MPPLSLKMSRRDSETSKAKQANELAVRANERVDELMAHYTLHVSFESLLNSAHRLAVKAQPLFMKFHPRKELQFERTSLSQNPSNQ